MDGGWHERSARLRVGRVSAAVCSCLLCCGNAGALYRASTLRCPPLLLLLCVPVCQCRSHNQPVSSMYVRALTRALTLPYCLARSSVVPLLRCRHALCAFLTVCLSARRMPCTLTMPINSPAHRDCLLWEPGLLMPGWCSNESPWCPSPHVHAFHLREAGVTVLACRLTCLFCCCFAAGPRCLHALVLCCAPRLPALMQLSPVCSV